MSKVKWLIALIIGLVWQTVVGFATSFLVDTNAEAYLALTKPSFLPPPIVFSIVWGVIYILMGIVIASIIVYKRNKFIYYILIIVINALNALWLKLFFGETMLTAALIVLVVATALNLLLFYLLYKDNLFSQYLMLPVIAWYLFATALNYSLIMLN